MAINTILINPSAPTVPGRLSLYPVGYSPPSGELTIVNVFATGTSGANPTSYDMTGVLADSGQMLAVAIGFQHQTNPNTAAVTINNDIVGLTTWTNHISRGSNGTTSGYGYTMIWTAYCTSSTTNRTITVSGFNAGESRAMHFTCWVFSNYNIADPFGVSGTSQQEGGGNNPVNLTLNAEASGSWIIGSVGNGTTATITADGNTTLVGDIYNGPTPGNVGMRRTSKTSAAGNVTIGTAQSTNFFLLSGLEIKSA